MRRHYLGVAGAAVLLLASAAGSVIAPADAAHDSRVIAAAAAAPSHVTLSVADVSPNTPSVGITSRPIRFTLRIDNESGQALRGVTVSATRADPIFTQKDLDSAIGHTRPPSEQLRADLETTLRIARLPVGVTTTPFTATISASSGTDICQCAVAIYPIYFTASGPAGVLATTQTYLPSLLPSRDSGRASGPEHAIARTSVAWVWPLLDRPHRLRQLTVFTDDDLATEVAPGGRLDRALTVLEAVAHDGIPMTVLTDPELIDELVTMRAGYRVATPAGTVTGDNGADAGAWLDRLAAVVRAHTAVRLDYTAPSDPAVESLTEHGLSWSARPDSATEQAISGALGVTGATDLAWPAGGSVSAATLTKLAADGAKTVVLTGGALSKGASTFTSGQSVALDGTSGSMRTVPADAIAALKTTSGTVSAAVTSPAIETLVGKIMTDEGGLALMPRLVSELAIRAITSYYVSHVVVIAPPRDLDVADVTAAERAIVATSSTAWSQPVLLGDAVAETAPVDHGALTPIKTGAALPNGTIGNIGAIAQLEPLVSGLYADPEAAADTLATLPAAIQRCESTGWLADRTLSVRSSEELLTSLRRIQNGVRLVKLSGKTYTLTSSDARLPVSLQNTLTQDVRIKIVLSSRDGGLTTTVSDVRTIRAGQRVQLSIATRVDRVGQITARLSLQTATGDPLDHEEITIRSTKLGTIGIVITVIAAIVLAIALLVRIVRRVLGRRRADPGPSQA